jgi:hypothetical protein
MNLDLNLNKTFHVKSRSLDETIPVSSIHGNDAISGTPCGALPLESVSLDMLGERGIVRRDPNTRMSVLRVSTGSLSALGERVLRR